MPGIWHVILEAAALYSNISRILRMKGTKKIVAVTSYDHAMATICEEAAIDILLVGDSAGMVMLGYPSTVPVTMEHMLLFTGAVARARKKALIVADMPFMSYQTGEADALRNAGRLIQEGADAVKIEGPYLDVIRAMTAAGIPVMGHAGLQPQSASLYRGYDVRAKTAQEADALMEECQAIQDAGAFCIVLEKVSYQAAGRITESLNIPTIGIGSGSLCDGQVLVIHDLLGMYPGHLRFVKQYATLSEDIRLAVSTYRDDVEKGAFPGMEHSFSMRDD